MFRYGADLQQGSRETMDDRALAAGHICEDGRSEGYLRGSEALFALCDGMGGYSGGRRAALIALSRIRDGNPVDKASLREALSEANRAITREAMENPEYQDMGCTVTGVLFLENQTVFFNAGDSRVYRLRGSVLKKMTQDNSEEERLRRAGVASGSELRNGRITKYLGGCSEDADITVISVGALPGDRYLLCSDGLWSGLDKETITGYLEQKDTPALICAKLTQKALEKGSMDNTSAMMIEFSDDIDAEQQMEKTL